MSLDPRFMIAPSVQEFFIDNATGLPMAGGKVFYYSDVNRSTLKPIYTLNGSPPNYSYVQLPNPVTLSGVGTTADANGNDVLPYYFPFDAEGNPELYFVSVYNAAGVHQFDRQAYPNVVAGGNNTTQPLVNLVPNGQFLTHDQPPANPLTGQVLGQIPSNQPTTYVAQGGWTFERPNPSTSTDIILFDTLGPTSIPLSNPRFAINIQNTVPGTDTFKYLGIRWPDVNKFSTPTTSSPFLFTFGFSAKTNNGSTQQVQISVKWNYGTGGTPTSQVIFPFGNPITVTPTYQGFTVPIDFGNNNGAILGTNGDDYVEVIIGLPPSVFMSITDVFMVPTNLPNQTFPLQTNDQMFSRAVSGFFPTPDPTGLDNYLPLVLTPVGSKFDHSLVGKIRAQVQPTVAPGEVICDGTSYPVFGTDTTIDPVTNTSTGIPFSRLWSALFVPSLGGGNPIFGAGPKFSTSYLGSTDGLAANTIRLYANSDGSFTAAADGTSPTGFTFTNITIGMTSPAATAYCYFNLDARPPTFLLAIVSNNIGPVIDNAQPGTSAFVTTTIRGQAQSGFQGYAVTLVAPTNAPPTAGTYFDFSTITTQYRVWYKVNGGGSPPPSGGRVLIAVNIVTGMSFAAITYATAMAINGYESDLITTVAGNVIPAGAFFTFNNTLGKIVVWYSVNGIGTAPSVGQALSVKIPINSTDTNAQVAQKTIYFLNPADGKNYGINTQYFAVPDLRGKFVRGWDNGERFDPDAGLRFSNNNLLFNSGDTLGTLEYDDFDTHSHPATISVSTSEGAGPHATIGPFTPAKATSGGTLTLVALGNVSGQSGSPVPINAFSIPQNAFNSSIGIPTNIIFGDETRPPNINVQYVIHL